MSRSPIAGRAAVLPLLLPLAVSGLGCGDEPPPPDADAASAPAGRATSAPGSDNPSPGDSRTDMDEALADAMAVEMPAEDDILHFNMSDAVFKATGASTYLETLSISVADAQGRIAYRADLETRYRAEPSAFHLVGSQEGDDLAASSAMYGSLALGERFEILRIGEEVWRRSNDGWTAPTPRARTAFFQDPGAARALTVAYRPDAFTDPIGQEMVSGRATAHYRVEPSRLTLVTMWLALTDGLHIPVKFPDEASGQVDLWMQENDLVLRARYAVVGEDGSEWRAAVELSRFDEPVSIEPPER